MSLKEQSIVAGFRNLLELRDIVFRYSEFKTAQDVGLKVPDSKTETLLVDMDEAQARTYYKLADRYTATLKQMGHAAEGGKKLTRCAIARCRCCRVFSLSRFIPSLPMAQTRQS